MNRRRGERTTVIGAHEITVLALALAFFLLAAFVFVLGVSRLGRPQAVLPTASVEDITTQPPPQVTFTSSNHVAGAQATLTPSPTPGQFEHVVQTGETLTTIATFYGIDLGDLLRANGLRIDSTIREGQILIIPLPPSQKGTWHIVEPGEALIQIAERYGVPLEVIQAANHLTDANAIFVGQRLRIPLAAPPEATAQPAGSATASPTLAAIVTATVDTSSIPRRIVRSDWPRSILEGDLDENYPLTYEHERFTLHYQPGTYADRHLSETVALAAQALEVIEERLNVRLSGTFDIYIAGTLFAAPNAHLHGLSRSAERKVFILHDGSGTPTDNLYFFIHEMTHLVAWNTWGSPSSTMLSEGVATYAGKAVLEEGGYLPYDQLCAAIYSASLMPSMATVERDWQAFLGHVRHYPNYFGSACFVDYLIATYGLEKLSRLYHTSDYEGLYGASLGALDAQWQQVLAGRATGLRLNPADLAAYTEEVGRTYDFVLANFNSTETMYLAYAAADQARIALWRGQYTEVRKWLDKAYAVLGYKP